MTSNLLKLIGQKLKLEDLSNFCLVSQHINYSVCENQTFWKMRYKAENKEANYEAEDDNWLEHYKKSLQTFVVYTPRERLFVTRAVILISAGDKHSGFLTLDHNLYVTGQNDQGQLGLAQNIIGKKNHLLSNNIKWFYCHNNYTLFIDHKNICYGTGNIGPIINFPQELSKNVKEAFITGELNQKVYLKLNSDLYVQSSSDKFINLYGPNEYKFASKVRKLCQSDTYPMFIGYDSSVYTVNWPKQSLYKEEDNCDKYVDFFDWGQFDTYKFRLTSTGDLVYKDKNQEEILANNIKDFEVTYTNRIFSLIYLTNKGQVYIAGIKQLIRKIPNTELYLKILSHFDDIDYNIIRQRLLNNPEQFPIPELDNMSDYDIKNYLLNLDSKQQVEFLNIIHLELLTKAQIDILKHGILITDSAVMISKGSVFFGVILYSPKEKRYRRRFL